MILSIMNKRIKHFREWQRILGGRLNLNPIFCSKYSSTEDGGLTKTGFSNID